jgi:hypothetical protein
VKRFLLILGLAAAVFTYTAHADGERVMLAQSSARGMAFDVFIRLERGMSEGELLLRAGKPDSESVENMRYDIVKTYYYFPTASDPWITTIRVVGGRIADLDRIKKF